MVHTRSYVSGSQQSCHICVSPFVYSYYCLRYFPVTTLKVSVSNDSLSYVSRQQTFGIRVFINNSRYDRDIILEIRMGTGYNFTL